MDNFIVEDMDVAIAPAGSSEAVVGPPCFAIAVIAALLA